MAQERHIRATFVKGATAPEHFPAPTKPEIAFIGRSNVGKSSLINTLVRHHGIARVSNTPGKTQEINFFKTDQDYDFVDLPGYGYAQVSKTRREEFSSLIKSYLFQRSSLVLACVLVDSRHDPMPLDLSMIEELEFGRRSFAVILTKTDKLKPQQLAQRIEQFKGLLSNCRYCADVIATSSESGIGRNELLGMFKRLTLEFNEASA